MVSNILIVLTVIVAILGILVEVKNPKTKKLNIYGYILIILLLVSSGLSIHLNNIESKSSIKKERKADEQIDRILNPINQIHVSYKFSLRHPDDDLNEYSLFLDSLIKLANVKSVEDAKQFGGFIKAQVVISTYDSLVHKLIFDEGQLPIPPKHNNNQKLYSDIMHSVNNVNFYIIKNSIPDDSIVKIFKKSDFTSIPLPYDMLFFTSGRPKRYINIIYDPQQKEFYKIEGVSLVQNDWISNNKIRSVNDLIGSKLIIFSSCLPDSSLIYALGQDQINPLITFLQRIEINFGPGKLMEIKNDEFKMYHTKGTCYIYIYDFPKLRSEYDSLFIPKPKYAEDLY